MRSGRSSWTETRRAFATAVVLLAGCGPAPAPSPAPAPVAAATSAPQAAPRPASPGPKVFPMEAAPALDGPGRDEWQKPDEVIAALGIRPGERIADVGCGTGYFTLRLLRAAGPTGRVLAVDIQQGMLDLLAGRLAAGEKGQVTLRRNTPDRPLEPTDALDLVLCANTLHEVDDADAARFMSSMADALAPGGRLALLNWRPGRTRLGPPPQNRISPERVRELAEGAGLTIAQEIDLLPTHSFLVFTRGK